MVLIVTVPCNCLSLTLFIWVFFVNFGQLTFLANLRRNITVRLVTMNFLLVTKFSFILTYHIYFAKYFSIMCI